MWPEREFKEPLEELRALGAAYPEIRRLAEKYRRYRLYEEKGGEVNEGDHAEISVFIRDVSEEGGGTGTRELVIEDLDRMGRDIAFYLRRTKIIGISLPRVQGYLLPENLAGAQMWEIVEAALGEPDADLVVLRHDDQPIAIVAVSRIEGLLKQNRPDILEKLRNANNEDQGPGGPEWLKSKTPPEQMEAVRQERIELLTHETMKELMQLLAGKIGNEVTECDDEGVRPSVETLVKSYFTNSPSAS